MALLDHPPEASRPHRLCQRSEQPGGVSPEPIRIGQAVSRPAPTFCKPQSPRSMKNKSFAVLFATLLLFAGNVSANDDAPYTEGTVWELTLVRAKHGMVETYLKSLAGTFDAVMREAQKQDLILDYKILLGHPGTADDFNILLMVETRNMAEQDNVRERWGKIVLAAEGDSDHRFKIATQRVDMREVLGIKLMREIDLQP